VQSNLLSILEAAYAETADADTWLRGALEAFSRGRVRIVRDAEAARVEIDGEIAPDQAQRLRNVIGNVPLVRLGRRR
jgi:hypothetical protein